MRAGRRNLNGAHVRAITRIYDLALSLCGLVSGFVILAIAGGIVTDVLYRNLAGGSVSWMLEGTEYALCVAVFLSIPWCMREGAHVRMDALLRVVSPRLGRNIELVADLVGFAIAGCVAVFGALGAWEAFESNTIIFKSIVFPEWWILAVLPVSMAFLAVEFLRRIARLPDHGLDTIPPAGL